MNMMRALKPGEFAVQGYYTGNKKRYTKFTSYALIKREMRKKYPCNGLNFPRPVKSVKTLEKYFQCSVVEVESYDYEKDLSAIGIDETMKCFVKIFATITLETSKKLVLCS